jgi:hypothetical protein
MRREALSSLSFFLLLGLATHQTNAAYLYQQDSGPDGIVSMESEHFENNVPQGFNSWTLVTLPAGASGSKAMQALPNAGFIWRDDYITYSPRLDFRVGFVKTGTHYVWVRANANGSGNDNSCHAGLDNQANTTSNRLSFNATTDWGWFNTRYDTSRATFNVPSTGVHTVNIWMCEDGAVIDKIVLTTNPAYVLSDKGPKESPTENYLSVDDFEYYDATAKLIIQTWIPTSGSGTVIGHPNPPYVEQTIVHAGKQSMPYYYDNNRAGRAYYSEAQADTAKLEIGSDWTKEGVKALTLYFYGDPGNDADDTEQMYMSLEDSGGHIAVVKYDGDANDIKKKFWQEWNIELKKLTSIDLSNITKLYIGFGDRYNHPVPGGKGIVYFDDIRLYPPRCVPARAKPAGDINSNCIVDYADLVTMTDEWLNVYQFGDFALLADSWLEEVLWPQ